MNNLYKTRLGFTLVELLVSISVLLVVISISIMNYSNVQMKQKLISSGQEMKNIIRDAQSRAYNGEIACPPCDCSPNATSILTGWYVDFLQGKIYGQCTGGTFSDTNFDFDSEIIITPHITPAEKLLFHSFPLSPDQKATICLSNSNLTGKYYVIYVNNYGDISDESGLVDTCVPN